jgi:helicase
MSTQALQSKSASLPVDKPTCLLGSGFSVVLQMPTGSGKTHRAGRAIREAVERGFRAIYVCPTRALANELYARWVAEWADVRVGVFTGDFGGELEYPVPFKLAQVLVMTAEMFDACTRQWRHHWNWLPEVDIVVVDELHLLADRHRGPRLEGAMLRMRTLNPFVRIVGLSATLGNAGELADWLDGACFVSRHRPIETVWRTVTFSRADEKPQKLLDALGPVLTSSGLSLVFVQSKRRAESLAQFLRAAGVAADHHHGGLTLDERRAVEERFRSKQLRVLVATSTLEVGLNLPVRQVVLYDLQQFDGTEFQPLSVISVWQRAGRAGRPGLDDKAEVVLFRARWERDQHYELGRFEAIESKLGDTRHLNEQAIVAVCCGYARSREELRSLLTRTLAARQGLLGGIEQSISQMCEAGFLAEDEGASSAGLKRLRATPLGRICARRQVGPDSVLRLRTLFATPTGLTHFDLMLLACSLPDSDASVPVDFEELSTLTEHLAQQRSHLLASGDVCPTARLGVDRKRLLVAAKAALILSAWTETGDEQLVAQRLGCYVSEVVRLRESAVRLLTVMQDVLRFMCVDDPDCALQAKILAAKVARVQLMVTAGVDQDAATLMLVPGIGKTWARRLVAANLRHIEDLAQADAEDVVALGGVSRLRAAAWIDAASKLLDSDAISAPADTADHISVAHGVEPIGFDIYRLRRSWSLQITPMPDDAAFAITGGTEPHVVRRLSAGWACDCADHGNGHICKHVIAVRRYCRDEEVLRADALLGVESQSSQVDLRTWWAR